jgi:hypothetical protein
MTQPDRVQGQTPPERFRLGDIVDWNENYWLTKDVKMKVGPGPFKIATVEDIVDRSDRAGAGHPQYVGISKEEAGEIVVYASANDRWYRPKPNGNPYFEGPSKISGLYFRRLPQE